MPLLAAFALVLSGLPGVALANEAPSLLIEHARAFDSRTLLTQAPSFAEFRKSSSAEPSRAAKPATDSILALSRDLAGYLAKARAGTDSDARAQVPGSDIALADTRRADAARAAIRRSEQRAAARGEPQPRRAARNEVRPPLKLSAEQLSIARSVAERYRVSYDEIQHFVAHAYDAAREFRLDPHLVLAVVAIESSFNPKARSKKGAQGLMQVLTRVHTEKFAPFGGPAAAFDPVANLRVGSRILKEYLVREGSVEGALKSYVGAALLKHDYGYGKKVLTERKRIASAGNAPAEGSRLAERNGAADVTQGKARAAGGGYVKVAANGFGKDEPDGESPVQRLLKSPIGY